MHSQEEITEFKGGNAIVTRREIHRKAESRSWLI